MSVHFRLPSHAICISVTRDIVNCAVGNRRDRSRESNVGNRLVNLVLAFQKKFFKSKKHVRERETRSPS